MITAQDPSSVLFVTLDSCRYDTFAAAEAPNLKAVGSLHRAMAPGNFTYASHAAMFVGFTPSASNAPEPYLNPKFTKIFKMVGPGFVGAGREQFALSGRNVIDGFKRKGYLAVGSGAVDWFDTRTETGRQLTSDFDYFLFAGNSWSLEKQIEFLSTHLARNDRPVFAFLNVGETHVPYYHAGADWDPSHYVCVPFGKENDAAECRRRQRLCLEFVDRQIAPLLNAFTGATTIVCGDHGDCWGEDGLWEHGIHHPKVYEVPLLFRIATR